MRTQIIPLLEDVFKRMPRPFTISSHTCAILKNIPNGLTISINQQIELIVAGVAAAIENTDYPVVGGCL